MKNNFLIIAVILFFNLITIPVSISYEQFNFDVTEVEIKEDGNRFLGKKRGTATTDKGILINADEWKAPSLFFFNISWITKDFLLILVQQLFNNIIYDWLFSIADPR